MKRHARNAVAALTLGASLASCRDSNPPRVGIVSNADGVEGALFAAAEINANHGIRGQPLALRIVNEVNTEARPAIATAESLSVDPSVVAVVGHSNSGSSLAGSQIYNARRVVQIAPTSSAALLGQAGGYTFRLVASDVHQARYLADEIARGGEKPATAVFYVNDDYGRSLNQELRARLAAAQIPVVFELPYAQETAFPDVKGTVDALLRSGATELVWLGRASHLYDFLRELRPRKAGIRILASDGVDTRATADNADRVMTGVQFVCFVDIHGSRPQLVALRKRYHARAGRLLTAELALNYDAVMLVATAVREVGTRRAAILDYLMSLGRTRPAYEGATGSIAFDNDGDPRPSYCLQEVTAQGIRVVRSTGDR